MTTTSGGRRAVGFLVCAALLVSTRAVGSVVLPSPKEIPRHTVALVSHVGPGVGRITRREFQHALAHGAAMKRVPVPSSGERGYERLKDTALGELLDLAWIEGQAAEMGIVITSGQVSRVMARLIKQTFKDRAEYRDFLRELRFTRREVRERVRVEILTTRILEEIEPLSRSERREFVGEFSRRWRERTVCAVGFATDRCSNGPSVPQTRIAEASGFGVAQTSTGLPLALSVTSMLPRVAFE